MILFKSYNRQDGFTRTDAVIMTGVVVLAAVLVWASVALAGEKRRIWVCAHHMEVLGRAFAEYSHEHDDALPFGVFDDGKTGTEWDKEIAPYLKPEWGKADSPEKRKALENQIAPYFKCPSDREPHGDFSARSYAMPIYDISRVGWPPDAYSSGGLGLSLNQKAIASVRQAAPVELRDDYIPAIKTSMAPAPDDTALLVERISILNMLWNAKNACIAATEKQFDAKTFDQKNFHYGKMNYLMLDGHVELMSAAESGGHLGAGSIGGVWTLQPGD